MLGWTLAASAVVSTPVGARRFVLLRHGQTDWNAEGRMQGTSDFSKLTALGLQQAVSTGDALCGLLSDTPVKAVYASPLSRAQHTLELVAGKWPAAATAAASHVVLEDLKEIELKEWSGRLSIDIKAEEPEAYRRWKEEAEIFELAEGFMPVHDLWERAHRIWSVIRADPATAADVDGVTLIVAHNAINQALLCTALGAGIADGFRSVVWPNCGAIEVELTDSTSSGRWRWIWPQPERDGWLASLPKNDMLKDVAV